MDTSFPTYIANLFLLWLLIFAIMLHKGMYSLRVHCNDKDHHLLLSFKSTIVDPSTILSTWSDERHCCDWLGVQCDNTTDRVIGLSLPCHTDFADECGMNKSHCLTGELHLSLLHLEFLNYLDLSNNNFQAIIQPPQSSENSSNLHYLDLSDNEDLYIDNLHWLSRISSLKYLDLSSIDLQGKVDWLQLATPLPSLTELYLDYCQLNNVNPSLQYANFTSLEVVHLSNNAFGFNFFPDWLFNISGATIIDLSYNYFQGQLPERFLSLQKIEILNLCGNKLSGPIPDWLGQLEHLQFLGVGENLFSGPIPSTLGNLSSLNNLDVSSNYLNGSIPESLGKLLNLEELYFSDNHFVGHVSERNFVQLSNLKFLSMGSPGLTFDFDPLWVPPFQLEIISLHEVLGSKFPSWIYTQTSLARLIITRSRISFESQDQFWAFAAPVTYMHLEKNMIDVDMSNVLLNSSIINLISNKLKGSLPRLSPNVLSLILGKNSFQGSISPLLCQKMKGRSQLKLLDLSNNLLSGELTNCWMYWKSLVIIRLDGNNFTGKIPPSISFLSNLKALHLSKNNLFGEIPLQLKKCQNLQILDVGENKFSGFLPNWIGNNIKILQLRSNQFSGTIPPQICQLASLIMLDLADNQISGSIPICLQNVTALAFSHSSYDWAPDVCLRTPNTMLDINDYVMLHIKGQGLIYQNNLKYVHAIDLSSNKMFGKIPPEIFKLIELQFLNLSHNLFEGGIPKKIGNLKQLESLDLANNQLSGEIPQTMAGLSSLGTLNLSFNNFIGKIPLGTQLQGFDALSYIGNPELCGAPLPKNCTSIEDMKPIEESHSQEDEFMSSFYIGMGVGFVTAFWGVCSAIFFIRNFRHSYFRFLYVIRDKLYVTVILMVNRFR